MPLRKERRARGRGSAQEERKEAAEVVRKVEWRERERPGRARGFRKDDGGQGRVV